MDTLVLALHVVLSPAEKDLASAPAASGRMRNFHRHLYTESPGSLRQEIRRITGVNVCEAAAEDETTIGTVVHILTTGNRVQVFPYCAPRMCHRKPRAGAAQLNRHKCARSTMLVPSTELR